MARRNSLKNKFGDMRLDEPLKIEIEGEEVELDIYAPDVSTFLLVGQNDGDIQKEHLDMLEDTLRKVLQRSYLPYYNSQGDKEMENLNSDQQKEQEEEKQFIEGLLTRYFMDLYVEIVKELGWSEGDIDVDEIQGKKD